MRVGYLITGRLKSTRLPKKLLLEVNGTKMISYMIERIKKIASLSEIILCTSTNEEDDPLSEIAREHGIKCFRGSEEDVIGRLYEACLLHKLDYALNITADCTLVSTEYIDKIIDKYKETNADLIRVFDLPFGAFSYGLKIDALRKICDIKKSDETEVWGRYFTDTGFFDIVDLEVEERHKRPEIRMTMDYEEDYLFFKNIIEFFEEHIYAATLTEILEYLDANPFIVELNRNCHALYLQRWESQNKIKI